MRMCGRWWMGLGVRYTKYSANQGLMGSVFMTGYYPFHWNVSPAKTKVVGFHVIGLDSPIHYCSKHCSLTLLS